MENKLTIDALIEAWKELMKRIKPTNNNKNNNHGKQTV